MIQPLAVKNCLVCGKLMKGRSDKKFCDDSCRAVYNNELRSGSNDFVRSINNALRKNRRILEQSVPAGSETGKINRDKLLREGFQFRYMTHTYTNKKGNTYQFCYEYGYLPLEHGWYLVVKNQK